MNNSATVKRLLDQATSCARTLDEEWIDLVWEYSVEPYLKDQLMGQEDRYGEFDNFDLKRIRQRIQDAQTPETPE